MSFETYLRNFIRDKNNEEHKITHTKIGDKNKNIFGGSYYVPQEKWDEFYNTYYEQIYLKGITEHLTEKQLVDNGGIFVDFDFRYNPDIQERQHTMEHIEDMIGEYIVELKNIIYLMKIQNLMFL